MTKTVFIPPANPEAKPVTFIWLHAMGTNVTKGKVLHQDLLRFAGLDNINLVLPSAPQRLVTTVQKWLPAWYDLYHETLHQHTQEDIEGMNDAMAAVQAVIDEERRKNPDTPIVLGGFSQGGVVALLSGLAQTVPLLAIVVFSGHTPDHPRFIELSDQARETPIFVCHGTLDPLIPILKVEEGVSALINSKANVEFRRYPIMHEVSPDEFKDLGEFLRAHFENYWAKDDSHRLIATASLEESFHTTRGKTQL